MEGNPKLASSSGLNVPVCWVQLREAEMLKAHLLTLVEQWRRRWQWHKKLLRFDSVKAESLIVRYDPAAINAREASRIARKAVGNVRELTSWCHCRLARRAFIFVLPSENAIQDSFGTRCGGIALCDKNAIVVSAGGDIDDVVRHELAHLFTAKWNRYGLPLLNEGFATWWQQRGITEQIDAWALHFMCTMKLRIGELLNPVAFYESEPWYKNYYLAGSFAGNLIRRYGKQQFCKFYRRAKVTTFECSFRNCFGITLDDAEDSWRIEIATMPVLRQKLERQLRL